MHENTKMPIQKEKEKKKFYLSTEASVFPLAWSFPAQTIDILN
jgi:hypothetical protein